LIVTSDADGRFKFVRGPTDEGEPITIVADLDGYERAKSAASPWGSKDVTLVLQRGLGVDVVVHDGDRGMPLERYGVRCIRVMGGGSTEDMRLREVGAHPGGVVTLAGIRRGRSYLVVEPTGPEWVPSAPRVIDVTNAGVPRQEITVRRACSTVVRVKSAAGAPVAETRIDLLLPLDDAPVHERTIPRKAATLGMGIPGTIAMLVAEGTTGQDGRAEIRGTPGLRHALRILGPGHVPLVRDLVLDPAIPVVDVIVAPGATLRGRIVPLELVGQLHSKAITNRGTKMGPRVSLRGNGYSTFPPGREQVPLDDEGAFVISGVPHGSWDVVLQTLVKSGSVITTRSRVIGHVKLLASEDLSEVFDLGDLLMTTIRGTVTLDGTPFVGGHLVLMGEHRDVRGEVEDVGLDGIEVSAEGTFGALVSPGTYRLLARPAEVTFGAPFIHDDDVFSVGPGQTLQRTFELQSSVLRARVLGSDGSTPVTGLRLSTRLKRPAAHVASHTDPEGRCELRGLPPGPVELMVMPKSLSSDEALREHMKSRNVAYEDVLVLVATVDNIPPVKEVVITLPVATGY
jgi:hypothetical protein